MSEATDTMIQPLTAGQLYRNADLAKLDFSTTAELEPIDGLVGQTRALDAIRFGTQVPKEGFNLFVIGPQGARMQEAVKAVLAREASGAEAVLHCGDVVAPSTLNVLKPLGLPVHVIHGNNSGDLYMMARIANKPSNLLTFYGQDAGIELAGRKIFLVHYPHYAKAMATTGDWDLVCCGHDHAANIEQVENIKHGTTWVVNPGTVGGIKAPATWVMGDLDAMTFEIRNVGEACITHSA